MSTRLFRWKAIVPMTLTVVIVAVLWWLFVDLAVRRSVEFVGTELVGAKVELASARLRLLHADLVLNGLQVTNPNAPMTNLVEVPEIVADLNGAALLRKKVVVETLAVRGVRFGTPRRTSGALKDLPPTAGLVTRRVLAWANAIRIPSLDLSSLAGTVVRVPAISPDSLRSVRLARQVSVQADSSRAALERELRGLDPGPLADSASALVDRLKAADPRRLTPVQTAALANDARTTIAQVARVRARLDSARARLAANLTALRDSAGRFDAARQADYAYARGLVNLPSFAAPDVSMALFGQMVTERLKPVLYWVGLAEQYAPPGLDPRRRSGPKRLRMAGTNFVFPVMNQYPTFLVEHADADLAIGGRTAAAGAYRALVTGVTNEPAVYGRPLRFEASRTSSVGPRSLRIGGMMDRVGATPVDSLQAVVPGVQIPAFTVPGVNASLDLGDSSLLTLSLAHRGGELNGVWRLASDAVRWTRPGADTAAAPVPRVGTPGWAEALLWRSVSSIPGVTIEARISGPLTGPRVSVTSNVGGIVSGSLQQAVGDEVRRAEASVRAKVDSVVTRQVADARAKVAAVESQVQDRVTSAQERLRQAETDLNEQVTRLTSTAPGVRLPGGVRLPRP